MRKGVVIQTNGVQTIPCGNLTEHQQPLFLKLIRTSGNTEQWPIGLGDVIVGQQGPLKMWSLSFFL